jgi:hypothetical protein
VEKEDRETKGEPQRGNYVTPSSTSLDDKILLLSADAQGPARLKRMNVTMM